MIIKHYTTIIIIDKTRSLKIGSGKISRRVILEFKISSPPRRSNNRNLNEINFIKHKRIRGDEGVYFGNTKHKIIFNKWNSLGHPFVKHRVIPGPTLENSLKGIARACKRHDTKTIVTSMEACHNLFKSPTFKFQYSKRIRRLRCYEFFNGYDKDTIERLNGKLKIKSWFKESLRGIDYLKQKYDIINTVKNRATFNILKVGWEEYDKSVATNKEILDLISCSNRINSFAKKNKKGEYERDVASAIINWLKREKPNITTAYLRTDAFWQKRVPNLLRDSGIIDEWEKVKW